MQPTLKDIYKTLLEGPPQVEPCEVNKHIRAEKRRIEREQSKANKTLNMTRESLNGTIKAAREDERERVKKFIVMYYSASVALVLHDKWGFGHKRLTRVVDQINDLFESILLKYVDIEDIRKALKEETGVDL